MANWPPSESPKHESRNEAAHSSGEPEEKTELVDVETLTPDRLPTAFLLGPGDVLCSRWSYRLDKSLGAGGFGAVYLAERIGDGDTEITRNDEPPLKVAIKVYRPPVGVKAIKLLKRELSSLLALRHERIPRVFDWRVDDDLAFVAMPYYTKGNLSALKPSQGRMDDTAAMRLLADLLGAIRSAHQQDLLHLDIKPSNVLLADDGGFVLADFGIAQGRYVSWDIVDPGMGTRGYRSPEQDYMDESRIDGRTDLWGVGITVWSAYTGINLADGDLRRSLVSREEPFRLPPLNAMREDCPQELNDIVMWLIQPNQVDRPSCAAEVLERIARVGTEQWGLGASDIGEALRRNVSPEEQSDVLASLMDPLWHNICSAKTFQRHIVKFEDGEAICREGDRSFLAYVLLQGRVRIERGGKVLATEDREGVFLGEVAALTEQPRTASMIAEGSVWALIFNVPELERLVIGNGAVGIRLIRTLANRLVREASFRTS